MFLTEIQVKWIAPPSEKAMGVRTPQASSATQKAAPAAIRIRMSAERTGRPPRRPKKNSL